MKGALGSVDIDLSLSESIDMNDMRQEARPNDWPNDFDDLGQSWLHSEIADIPYYFTYPKFDIIVAHGARLR